MKVVQDALIFLEIAGPVVWLLWYTGRMRR